MDHGFQIFVDVLDGVAAAVYQAGDTPSAHRVILDQQAFHCECLNPNCPYLDLVRAALAVHSCACRDAIGHTEPACASELLYGG